LPRRLLAGGYSPPRGAAAGITLVEHDREAGLLRVIGTAARTESPSALALSADGETVFAVQESDPGVVHSYRWSGEASLVRVSSQLSGGADPCHLLPHPSGRHLLTANYSGSTIAAHPIAADGSLGPASGSCRFDGSGPDPERQAAAHPHMIALCPGTSQLVVADLGSDCLRRIGFDSRTGRFGPERPPVALPAGTGPRQIVFSRDGRAAYVLGEFDSTLTALAWTPAGPPRVTAHLPGPSAQQSGNHAASLVLSGAEDRLLASHRGADVVTVFGLDDGLPRLVGEIPAGGRGPRHIALVDRWLYIANEWSGTLVARDIDQPSNAVVAAVASATFVLPLPISCDPQLPRTRPDQGISAPRQHRFSGARR
jgi:6-phosphogluconolactonase (cycloisomerase 2 family)